MSTGSELRQLTCPKCGTITAIWVARGEDLSGLSTTCVRCGELVDLDLKDTPKIDLEA